MTTSIGIIGAAGRMGHALVDRAKDYDVEILGGFDREGAVMGTHQDLAHLASGCDVLIDFSSPAALARNLEFAAAAGTAILVGTTGLGPEHHAQIDLMAASIAILQTANTSLGVNLLARLIEQAARALGPAWDIDIVEMHHRHKLDTPSGTALLLGAAANAGRGAETAGQFDRFDRMQEGRHAREEGGIYYASLRGGSVAGDHQVIFATEGERIEIGHRAESRAIFARGALRGAMWLKGKPAGRYTMVDVLGI